MKNNNNFLYLLIALLIVIVGIPIAFDLGLLSLRWSRVLAVCCLLAVGIWSLHGRGRLYLAGMVLVIIGIVTSILSIVQDSENLYFASQLALLLFLSIAIIGDLREVAVGTAIDANRIIGAMCVFLMLGVLWSTAYALLEFAQPGSFEGLTESASRAWNPDWIYFSFVTITTLGYGDILPITPAARSLAFAEAVAGQFYIAVLVAGLVGAYIGERGEQKDQD